MLETLGTNTCLGGVLVKLGLEAAFTLGLAEFKLLFVPLFTPIGKLLFAAELPTPGAKLFPGLVVVPLLNLDELTTPGARVASTLAVLGKVVVGAKGLAVTGSGGSLTWLTVVRLGWRCERAIVLITALAPTIPAKAAIF